MQNLLKKIASKLAPKKNLSIFLMVVLFYPFCAFSQETPISDDPLASSINAPKDELKDGIISSTIQPEKYKVSSLSFAWNEPVSIAVFKRNKYLWIIFDQKQNLDINDLTNQAAPLAKNLVQVGHSKGTVLRLTPNDNVNVSVRKEGFLWIVDLYTRQSVQEIKDLSVFVQTNSVNEPYLFIPTTYSGNILSFVDPDIGDNVIVTPVAEIGKGLNEPYKYPDLELIPSIQGLIIVPKSNDLVFNRGNTGISVKALNRGLHISPNIEILKRRELLSQTSDDVSSLSKQMPLQLLKKPFSSTVLELKQAVLMAEGTEAKENAQIELARYYVGKGMATNAITILKQMEEEKLPITTKEKFHGLYGVANFMARRYKEAIDHFSFGQLPSINEAVFWRTLSSSALEFKKEDNVILQSFIYLIKDYPDKIKEKIATTGVEIAIRSLDDISSQNFIDILKVVGKTNQTSTMVDYFTAEKMMIQSYPSSALKEYRKASEGKDLKYSSFAKFESTILSNKMGVITNDKAIGELEKLKFAWGERTFKLKLLENLSTLYEKNKDYYNALNSLKIALPLADDRKKSIIIQKMVLLFEDVFVLNQADHLPALKSISLYQDFDWLAPLSKHYNDIIQNLADRLVAVDLLDRADEILRIQIKNPNLSEEEKAKTGARLALINLFGSNYKEALDALDETNSANISETTKSQRRIIRAKALASLGQDNEALKLLQNDTSRNALLVKSEIYWNSERWGEASDTIKYLIDPPVEGKPLDPEQVGFILDWITTLKKAKKETIIIRIRNKFYPFFKDTKFAASFNVLTNHLENDEVNIQDVQKTIKEVESFSNFTRSYINSLKSKNYAEPTLEDVK